MVRIVIGALTDKAVLKTNTNVVGMSFHAAMFGELAKFFKLDMVDPLDKPPSVRKTYDRILTFLIGTFFNEASEEIAKGCAISMKEILDNVFPELLEPANFEQLEVVFLKPLLAILRGTGMNKNAVSSASFCLRFLI